MPECGVSVTSLLSVGSAEIPTLRLNVFGSILALFAGCGSARRAQSFEFDIKGNHIFVEGEMNRKRVRLLVVP